MSSNPAGRKDMFFWARLLKQSRKINIHSQPSKIGQIVKQSSMKGRKLILGEVAETVNTDQDIN